MSHAGYQCSPVQPCFVFLNWRIKTFTMLYWFLPYNNMNHPQVTTCPLLFEPSSHPPHLIPPFQVITEHGVELPPLYSKLPLGVYFTYGNVYVSMLFSQFILPFPSPAVSTGLFSMSMSLFSPCKQVHQYHFPRFHIYAIVYNICFSLSDFDNDSVQQALGSSTSLD